ncbi:ARM repeat-containing protein [Dacryopinax primogenitus]|uniref:ARM repeat-containing protein n=1 Tax=Dacryopinax primogenitus (strain DJM 731) TaxID=1858805 RepID=M5G3L3_DACPD|nr:ARM repeat-containing protein [Dacryopinax primogenitus]EJU03264.1 ARM repeat-containing protein [Dacryopinax primogenitus]
MDVSGLVNLFTATYSVDQNVRMTAEIEIHKVASHESFIPAVMQIISATDVSLATRQAAAVYLKNSFTSGLGEDSANTQKTIAVLKSSILPLIGSSPSHSITSILRTTLGYLVKATWPEEWPELETDVRKLLASGRGREIFVGLISLLEMLKAFRYSSSPHVANVTANIFPLLHPLATKALTAHPSTDKAEILHLVVKCYWMSIQQDLAVCLQAPEGIMPWGTLFLQIVSHQVPLSVQGASPDDLDDLAGTPYWKAKKWAFRVLNRLFRKYGNPSQLPAIYKKEYTPFATKFIGLFAPEILRRYLAQLELYVSAQQRNNWEQGWMTDRCLCLILDFLTESIKPKSTWELLKPHVPDLIRHFVYPILRFTTRRAELWEADPVTFVQESLGNFEDLGWPDPHACGFLLGLARSRSKSSYQIILTHISDILGQYPGSQGPESKYGVLTMIMALDDIFVNHPLSKGHVNDILTQHIIPELTSPHAYMRSIACDVITKFEENGVSWVDGQLLNTFQIVMGAMRDAELPVRVNASFAFSSLMEQPEVRPLIAPHIGEIIQAFLKLSDELGLDTLSAALDNVVAYFADELKQLALPIIVHLCGSYNTLFSQIEDARALGEENNDDEITDKTMAAIGVLRTIGVIIDSQKDSPDLLKAIQMTVLPIILRTLEQGNVDMFDEIYTLTDSLLTQLNNISSYMWQVFEATYKAFKILAVDYFEDMMPVISFFIEHGVQAFSERPDYCAMIVDMFRTIAFEDSAGAWDRRAVSMIAETFIMQSPGLLNQSVAQLVEATIRILILDGEDSPQRTQKVNVLLSLLAVYPTETLIALEATEKTSWAFEQWLHEVPKLARVHDLQLIIVMVSRLMDLPSEQVPPPAASLWPIILSNALRCFTALPAAEQKREEIARKLLEEDVDEMEDEDEDDHDDASMEEDEEHAYDHAEDEDGDVIDEETEYINQLAEEAARLRAKSAAILAGQPIPASELPDEDDDDEEEEEDWFFETAVDKVDPYIKFAASLHAFQTSNPQAYVAATSGVGQEGQVALMEIGKKALERSAS